MTIDEAIRHCEEVAWENDRKAMCVEEAYQTTEQQNCEQCAADHRQLAEWLTELKDSRAVQNEQEIFIHELMGELEEAKRLLKAAVDDFKKINSDILTCKYCRWYSEEIDECTYYPDDVPCERICGWKHEAEALKLIGGETDEHS